MGMTDQVLSPVFNESLKASVTLAEALGIFDTLADLPDIAFGYINDGCYARAHIMCRKLVEMGVIPKKAWAFEDDDYGDPLRFKSADGFVSKWNYHVSPVLSVEMPDGKTQDLVIDPAMFDGPVAFSDWMNAMAADPDRCQIRAFGEPPSGFSTDYEPKHFQLSTGPKADEHATQTMSRYRLWQSKAQRVLVRSPLRDALPADAQRSGGKTWVSARALCPPAAALAAEEAAQAAVHDYLQRKF